jgi:hypothetical protein
MITECDSAPPCCVSLADLDATKLLTVLACMVAAYSAESKTHKNHITTKSTATGIGIQGPLDRVGEYEYIESSQGSPDTKFAGCTKEWTRRSLG